MGRLERADSGRLLLPMSILSRGFFCDLLLGIFWSMQIEGHSECVRNVINLGKGTLKGINFFACQRRVSLKLDRNRFGAFFHRPRRYDMNSKRKPGSSNPDIR